jgi:hypothetical protein
MNNTTKIIIHAAIILILGYLWSVNFCPAKYMLSVYVLVLFFESKTAAFYSLFFIALLPFFVYGGQKTLAEHYAVSAYIFLSGCVLYVFVRLNKPVGVFFTISYGQILYILTKENIFKKESDCEKFDKTAAVLILSLVFIFLLLSPLSNFLLINDIININK